MLSNGNNQLVGIASVAKLFIADDLLSQEASMPLSSGDRQALDSMLRSSDDDAAETFWAARGGETIINAVAGRYGLTSTTPPGDVHTPGFGWCDECELSTQVSSGAAVHGLIAHGSAHAPVESSQTSSSAPQSIVVVAV